MTRPPFAPEPPTPTVTVEDLSMRFGRTQALDKVRLELAPGVTGLLGRNGAGKTTLLRLLATTAAVQRGQVQILGHDASVDAGRLAIRRRLGYLPQEPGFHRNFTAFEFVEYVAVLKELTDRRARRAEVRRVLDVVGLSGERHKKIKALSGGMRRRVGLAQALLNDPAVLILDEPTVGLDPEQRLRFRELISMLGEGRTVLLSTHQTEDVTALCQHVIVLHEGKVRFRGEPAGLTSVARGRVWTAASATPGSLAVWRTGTGVHRNIGTSPPPGANLAEPTLEDGYLLLLGADAEEPAVAS
jgi:ABC-2 type transport system ATP-binding protein